MNMVLPSPPQIPAVLSHTYVRKSAIAPCAAIWRYSNVDNEPAHPDHPAKIVVQPVTLESLQSHENRG